MIAYLTLTPAICAVAAAVLAWGRRDGWGWFLFVALLTYPAGKLIEPSVRSTAAATAAGETVPL